MQEDSIIPRGSVLVEAARGFWLPRKFFDDLCADPMFNPTEENWERCALDLQIALGDAGDLLCLSSLS